ncbi:MAG: BcsE family c-di-GMP-binding protein, partial [Janthinobacterium lividum]
MPAGAEARLGIADLPGEAGALCAGGLYAVEIESASTRFDLIIQTLRVNIALGIGCALLTPIPPDEWIARLRENREDDLIEYLRSGRLLLLSMVGDYGKNIFRFGAEGFAAELERCGVSDGFALVVDRADSLFSLHDAMLAARQSGVYRQWCRAHRISALLLFLSRPETSSTIVFRAMLDYFSGHARLRGMGSERAVEFDYWRGASGQVTAKRLALHTDEEGILRAETGQSGAVAASQNKQSANAVPAADEDDLITTDAYLAAARPPFAQGEWHHVRSFAGLLEMAGVITSATVVLDFTPAITLTELAEKVFALRQAMSERAKIVVREHDTSLRFAGTALLFKLGVNAVISGTTSAARIGLLM